MSENRVQVRQMGSFTMAGAGDRIKAFWETYPNGKILVKDNAKDKKPDELLVKKAFIWKDKKDYMDLAKSIQIADKDIIEQMLTDSSDANAEARQAEGKEAKKDFEKLETIAIGRALAVLGFLKDGQVASTEEMENFHEWENQKIADEVIEGLENLKDSKSLKDLEQKWVNLKGHVKKDEAIIKLKNDLKAKFLKIEEELKK